MAVDIITTFTQQSDSAGDPMSGALVYVYDVGTTTLKSVWSDTGLSVAAANPIVCDSAGRHDMRYIATGSYKIVVKTSAGATILTRDNIDPGVPIGSGALAIANGGTGATTPGAALTALGGATAEELADVSAEVAALSGTLASVEKTHIATGTTAQRPGAPIAGDIRRNTTTGTYEVYTGSAWVNVVTTVATDFLATDTAAGIQENATQAEQEAGSAVRTVTTAVQHFHKSAVKAWARITWAGGVPSLTEGYNFSSSVTDTAVGDVTLTFTTAMSTATYAVVATPLTSAGANMAVVHTATTTTVRIQNYGDSGNLGDPVALSVMVMGDI